MKKWSSLQCNSTDCAIHVTTPCALHPGRSLAQTLLWLLTVPPGTPQFPLTTCHRPQHPTRRGVRALAHLPSQDRFSPSSSERHPMLRHCAPPSCVPSRPAAKGTHGGVDGQLSAIEDGQTIDNELQSPGISGVAAFNVEVPDHDIRGHATTSFSAHLCGCPLQCKSPCSQDPCFRARCSMVEHGSRGDGHIGKCRKRREEEVGDDGTTTRGKVAGRVDRDVGNAIRTLLARGPLCDLHKARSGSVKLGQTTRATLCSCTARAAGFCHPCFGSTGFSSSSYPGRNPAKTAATCSRIHARPRNLVLGGGTGVSPLLLPRPGAFASHSGCSQPNWPSAHPLHCLMPHTTPILPNSLGLQLPFSRVLNLRRCPPTDRNTSTPRRRGLGRTPQTSEVSPSGSGNWLGRLRKTATRAMH